MRFRFITKFRKSTSLSYPCHHYASYRLYNKLLQKLQTLKVFASGMFIHSGDTFFFISITLYIYPSVTLFLIRYRHK